jgi:SAM-dependent methyltransferase
MSGMIDPATPAKVRAEHLPAAQPSCRFCGAALSHTFVDLGMSPMCESFLREDQLNRMEAFYPLHAYVCGDCFLVQLEAYVTPEEIFTEYAYFSSYSDSWLAHAKAYVETVIDRFGLDGSSLVVELASNDGYLLQYFVAHSIPVLGIEPARNVAKVAMDRGVETTVAFFDDSLAKRLVAEGKSADLIIGNNVLAQVPDLNGFVAGIKTLLKPDGVVTIEVPHLMRLMEENQFDTIYHEHFSYFSFTTAARIFAHHGMTVFDVEELPTHGGSLRLFAGQAADDTKPVSARVVELEAREMEAGLTRLQTYDAFREQVEATKRDLLDFLIARRREGKSIAGYGAPGKGNTLLNYCAIRTDMIAFTVDRNPYKHGMFLPGTHIPIHPPERIAETRPDYVVIMPWNLKDEIMAQLAFIRDWGGKFVVFIPEVRVYD